MRVLRLGILATEFFDERLGGFGGFGFAARRVAELCRPPSVPIEPVFIPGRSFGNPPVQSLDGVEVLNITGSRWHDLHRFHKASLDAIITIDWRPGFRYVARVSPRSDLVVWIHAPVAVAQKFLMASVNDGLLTIPAQSVQRPRGSNLASTMKESRLLKRRVKLATTSPALINRFASAHHLDTGHVDRIAYGIEPPHRSDQGRSSRPRVLILGRLSPEKRPWLVARIAERLPEAEFRIAGGGDIRLLGRDLPPNLVPLGHIDQVVKKKELEEAWLLLNTSVTEGVPISFIEALLATVPLVSTVDPEQMVSRFGRHVENLAGHGDGLVEPLTSAVASLVHQPQSQRRALGDSGRRWALEQHSTYAFYRDLSQLLDSLGHHEHSSLLLRRAIDQLGVPALRECADSGGS